MKRLVLAVTPFLLALGVSPTRAQSPSAARQSDKQVEATMKQVHDGLDQFVDKMNPQIRTAIIKNERGETDVKAFLNDLRKSSDAMKSRFNPPGYSANSEVVTFLTQALRLDDGIGRSPGMSGADPAWELVKPNLARLATAYGLAWSGDPGGWAATRMSDAEVKTALKEIQKGAEGLRKELEKDLKKDKALAAPARAAALAPAATLATTAKQAASSFSSGQDVAPLVGNLVASGHEVESVLATRKLAGPASSMWGGVSSNLGKVAKAYGLAPAKN